MPRGKRICPGGHVFHVLNRGNQRQTLFYSQQDYEAFIRVVKVNAPLTDAELAAVRRCAERGSPYGAPDWVEQTAKLLDLEHTLRTPGRPPKAG